MSCLESTNTLKLATLGVHMHAALDCCETFNGCSEKIHYLRRIDFF
jgi:hypothetical protein